MGLFFLAEPFLFCGSQDSTFVVQDTVERFVDVLVPQPPQVLDVNTGGTGQGLRVEHVSHVLVALAGFGFAELVILKNKSSVLWLASMERVIFGLTDFLFHLNWSEKNLFPVTSSQGKWNLEQTSSKLDFWGNSNFQTHLGKNAKHVCDLIGTC